MNVLAIAVFSVGFIVAVLGVFLPILPGVPLAAVAALVVGWIGGFEQLGFVPLGIVLGLTLLSLALDYAAGFIGAKRFGASRKGIIGSVVGAVVGLFLFPPFGFLIGAVLGAVGGELLGGRAFEEALRAAVGVLLGTLGGMIAQIFILLAIAIVVFPRLF